jgi:hypothetical protein
MSICLRRREFIAGLGGAAAWPLAARAQEGNRVRRIGVLMSRVATEPWVSQLTIFMQGMRKLGWIEGQNLETAVRWSAGDPSLIQAYATDLVGLFKPDVLLSQSSGNLVALQRATGTIPIVFVTVGGPGRAGFVPYHVVGHPAVRPVRRRARYSITSSARTRIDGGTARPSALAVLRFTIISNFVGNCTGRSPGFSPRRMRST